PSRCFSALACLLFLSAGHIGCRSVDRVVATRGGGAPQEMSDAAPTTTSKPWHISAYQPGTAVPPAAACPQSQTQWASHPANSSRAARGESPRPAAMATAVKGTSATTVAASCARDPARDAPAT